MGNHPRTLLNRINVCEYRLLVRVLRGGVVLNILRGVLVGVDLSRGYRREHVSGALAGGKPERRGNHGAHHPGRSWSLGFVQILAYMTSASALWNTLFSRHIRRLVRCIAADFYHRMFVEKRLKENYKIELSFNLYKSDTSRISPNFFNDV